MEKKKVSAKAHRKEAKPKTEKKEKPKPDVTPVPVPTPVVTPLTSDPYEIVQFVLMTEKAVRMIELQNKLVFMVRRNAKKGQIKSAVEAAFASPVDGVQTVIDQSGRKKAFVKFRNAGAAGDIAVRLGII